MDTPFKNFNMWLLIGFAAQFCFFTRFLIQYIVSEKRKESTIPVIFWYLSVSGAFLLFLYSLYRMDPVFILGSVLGLFVYSRNLYLIFRKRTKRGAACVS